MTVTVDANKRVRLRIAEPGERFDVQISADGKYVLTRLEPAQARPAKVRMEKRDGFTVGVLDRPINEQAIKEALAEFP